MFRMVCLPNVLLSFSPMPKIPPRDFFRICYRRIEYAMLMAKLNTVRNRSIYNFRKQKDGSQIFKIITWQCKVFISAI